MKSRAVRFKATGKGWFPQDMLRYDRCTLVDQSGITALILQSQHFVEPVTVPLVSGPDGRLTPDRWLSFGWTIQVD